MVSPYAIAIPDQRLAKIMAKVAAYDWSQLPDAGGWQAGVGVADLRRLVEYWRDSYDWRATERRMNRRPHFTTEIDGEHLHFIHLRGDGSRPPLLLLHGWPGSFLEFERLLDPLVADGHDVVVPSLPGYAFSQPITGVIGPRRAAALMHDLMARLYGQSRFIVQGGDWGSSIACWMAHDRPGALLGIHLNMVNLAASDAAPTTEAERDWMAGRNATLELETGYSHQQSTRPQTLGVALADSPVGLAGWILEKFGRWADLPKQADGSPDLWSRFAEADLLDTVMLYVGTGSTVTATWIYYGRRLETSQAFPAGTRIGVPTGVAAFPDPVFRPPPRSFAEKTFDIVHWSDMPAGGHFAAFEQPDLMLADLRAFIARIA